MDPLFDDLRGLARSWSAAGRLRLGVAVLLAAGTLLAVAGVFVSAAPAMQVTLGSLGGLAWFLAGYLLWYAGLGPSLRERLDLRGRWPLPRRRLVALLAALAWCLVLWAAGRTLGSSLLGALNVVVLLTVWRLFTTTAEERAALEEQVEQMWAAQQDDGLRTGVDEPPRRRRWRRFGRGGRAPGA